MTETKWLTIAEASLLCSELGLERTPKTIRGWARNEHVTAQKKSTSNGEMWILDKASLETKIKTEIEYRDQMKASQTGANVAEPVQTGSNTFEPVRTHPDKSDPVQTSSDSFGGYGQGDHDNGNRDEGFENTPGQSNLRDLQDQVLLLKNDIKWRDQVLKDQKNANLILMDEVKGQSRYIGHLETNVLRMGGKTDQAFLAAPVPKSGASEDMNAVADMPTPEIIQPARPHPDQSNLYTG